jgi:hypothetical protein
MNRLTRPLIIVSLSAAGFWLFAVVATIARMPGPAPCHCDPGDSVKCIVEDWTHRSSTSYVCGNEARWGRLP